MQELPLPPTRPSRAAFVLAFLAITVAGFLGGIIGYGITDIGSSGNRAVPDILGAIIGTLIAGVGVGIVSVLGLRAMAEWKRTPPNSSVSESH